MSEPVIQLVLKPVSSGSFRNDAVEPLRLPSEDTSPIVVGRATDADWSIPDLTVSRQHARLELRNGDWLVHDLGSKHGTFVNGEKLAENDVLPLRAGDEIRFGLWTAMCEDVGREEPRQSTLHAKPADRDQISRVAPESLGGIAQVRLEALINASRELEESTDRERVADVLVRCASAGTRCKRVLVVRRAGRDEYKVLASTADAATPTLSRTLLEAAAQGEIVELAGDTATLQRAQSLLDLKIHSAICAPLMIHGSADSFLYLDTRGSEGSLSSDSLSFCSALAQLGAAATARILTAEIAARRRQLEQDLDAARRAQQMLLPRRKGSFESLRYAFESFAGRFVAGDLFDILELPDRRTAFFLGDVSGKGVGAGVIMASTQTMLRTLLSRSAPLAESLSVLNEHVFQRTDSGTFLSLVAGVWDPASRTIEIADAGHGFVCRSLADASAERLTVAGGMVIGATGDAKYATEMIDLPRGARLQLFSDGVVEQPNAEGTQFGIEAALTVLSESTSADDDVSRLIAAVKRFETGPFADDLTVVSLQSD